MLRSSLLLCLLLALASFVCVESRAMFHDAILSKLYAKVLVKDSEGKCKKEAMKHKVNQIATNCAGLSAAVGVSQGAVVVGGVTTSIMTLKSQLDSYMEARCARLVHAASGVAKLKKAMPKMNSVNGFKKAKNSRPEDIRIPIPDAEHAASGVAKLMKAMPKINAMNAFKKAKKSRSAADARIPISRRWTH
ncbi:hypothetical protein AeNC1_018394 [Aphanomyces euteiches]|nr:hypothetical protein AeNC1_018394 [Aphanomyces euteiches]